jgi:hypothetical protein
VKSLVRLFSDAALAGTIAAIAVSGVSASPALAATRFRSPPWSPPNEPAVFVQTDNPAGNQVISYGRTPRGTLENPEAYSTGGDGAIASGSAVDPLASQDSLVLANAGRTLLGVNAGSDSVSVFQVFGKRLVLSEVVPSGGQFPVSIAVHGDLVYVLNSGGVGSIRGFRLFGSWLWPVRGATRSLDLSNSNPPVFLDSPGQIGFTPDGRQLIVTTKNSGSDIDVYSVNERGNLSSEPTINPAAAPVPFGFTFDRAGHLMVTEAGVSDLTAYSVGSDGSVTEIGFAADGQAALCWVTAVGEYFYGSNAGSASVSQFAATPLGVPQLVGVAASVSSGATDSAVTPDGRYLYVEQGGSGIVAEFHIGSGGSLTHVGTVSGLSAPMEGIAAN